MVPPPSRVKQSRDGDSGDDLPASTESSRPWPDGLVTGARRHLHQIDTPDIAVDDDMVEWEWEAFDSVPPPPTPTSPHPFAPQAHIPDRATYPTRSSRSERISARDAFAKATQSSSDMSSQAPRYSTLTRSSTATRSTRTYHTGSSRSQGYRQSGRATLSPDTGGAGVGESQNRPSPAPSYRKFEDWVDPEQQEFSAVAPPSSVADVTGRREEISISESGARRPGGRLNRGTGGVEDLMQQLEAMSGRMLAETYGYDVQRFDPTQRSARSFATDSHSGESADLDSTASHRLQLQLVRADDCIQCDRILREPRLERSSVARVARVARHVEHPLMARRA